jgi:hypothetical protein
MKKSQNSVNSGLSFHDSRDKRSVDWGRQSGTDEGDEVVGLVVAEEVLVQEHPVPYRRHGSRISQLIRFSMKSRRQTSRNKATDRMGMGAAYLGFQEIWREWCGYTTAAGYTELPLPPARAAPERPAGSVRRERRRRSRARAGGRPPAHGELAAIATERSLTHPPAPAPAPAPAPEEKGGRKRRAAARGDASTAAASGPLEVVATFCG